MKPNRHIVLVALLFASPFAWAGTVADGDLVTFTANSTAKAVEVNQNFTAIKNAVNTNFTDFNAAVNTKQNRVTGTCPIGYMKAIGADGTVTCGGTSNVTKYVNIPVYGTRLHPSDSAFNQVSLAPVSFPDTSVTGQPQLDLDFMVPMDYVAGTAVVLEIFWSVTGVPSGNVELRYNWGRYARIGQASASFGITNPSAGLATNTLSRTDHSLGVVFQPGDAIAYGIYRCVLCGTDTSANTVVIQGLRIRYTATP